MYALGSWWSRYISYLRLEGSHALAQPPRKTLCPSLVKRHFVEAQPTSSKANAAVIRLRTSASASVPQAGGSFAIMNSRTECGSKQAGWLRMNSRSDRRPVVSFGLLLRRAMAEL